METTALAQTTHDVAAPHGFAFVVTPATYCSYRYVVQVSSKSVQAFLSHVWVVLVLCPFPLLWP